MLREIIKKELLCYFISFRFAVGLILCVLLFSSVTYVVSRKYSMRLQTYQAVVQDRGHTIDKRSYSRYVVYRSEVNFPPNPLTVFAEGVDSFCWNSYDASPRKALYTGRIYSEIGKLSWFLIPATLDIDLSMIVGLFLSFWVMVLTYDRISGEREEGTLRFVLANGCPRSLILIGKYLSALIVLLVPLIIGFLSGLIIIVLHPKVILKGADFVVVGMILVLSVIYLSFWAGMGLLASSWARRSSTAMVLFVLIWGIGVIILPGLTSSLARSYFRMPKEPDIGGYEYRLRSGEYKRQVDKHLERIGISVRQEDLWKWIESHREDWKLDNSGDAPYVYDVKSDSGLDLLLDYFRYSELLWMNHYVGRLRGRAYPYSEELRKKLGIKWLLCQLSPVGLYYQGASALAGTSWKTMFHRLEDVRQYQEDLRRWMEREGLRTYKWFTDAFGQVDLRDVPSFRRFDQEPLSNLKDGMLQIAIILAMAVIVLFGCLYSFSRYDVR